MPRYSLAIALALASAGCSRDSTPTPPPAPPAVATSTDSAPPPDPAPPAEPAKPKGAKGQDTGLQGLLARYLNADGQGGWHPNEKAATELEKLAPPPAQIIPHLSDRQAEVRRGAAFWLLSTFDAADAAQVAALTAALADEDSAVRSIGRSAVAQMNTSDQIAAAPKLADLLAPEREAKADNRAAIARLLGSLKNEAAPAAPQLAAAAAGDPEAKVRAACLAVLPQVSGTTEAVAPLVKGLSDREPAVRVVATAQLRKLAAAAAPAAKELAAALSDSDQRVRENATEALILIGAPAAEPLAAILAGKQAEAKKYALVALGKIGPPAKAALAAVEKLTLDPDPNIKQLAVEAFRRMDP